MELERLTEPLAESNCWLLAEDCHAVVIDPNDPKGPLELLERRGWEPELILLTHEHCDHMAGLEPLRERFPGARVVASEACSAGLGSTRLNMTAMMEVYLTFRGKPGVSCSPFTCAPADVTYHATLELDWRGHRLRCVPLPGHTGTPRPSGEPWAPFDRRATELLAQLSEVILQDPDARRQEAVSAFGFWCRRAHLQALECRHPCAAPRLGRGLVFHIAPSNVPVMFAYSYAVGLLAGNANIVRLSSRRREEDATLLALFRRVLSRHREVEARTVFVSYERSEEITAEFCARCDARVVWGGDATAAALRMMPMPPHAVELVFPDRWSLAVFSQAALSALTGEERAVLAHRFYNDTYQMDQNACSSPQLVLWLEDGGSVEARRLWWEAVAEEAGRRYVFGYYQAARKLEKLCLDAMTMTGPPIARVERFAGNKLYVAELDALPADPTVLRGAPGADPPGRDGALLLGFDGPGAGHLSGRGTLYLSNVPPDRSDEHGSALSVHTDPSGGKVDGRGPPCFRAMGYGYGAAFFRYVWADRGRSAHGLSAFRTSLGKVRQHGHSRPRRADPAVG